MRGYQIAHTEETWGGGLGSQETYRPALHWLRYGRSLTACPCLVVCPVRAQKFDSWQFMNQFIQFVQINATILTLDIDWPPAIRHFVHVVKGIFLLTFDLIPVRPSTHIYTLSLCDSASL